jgi:predicted nucleic acid-binding protein
LPEWRISVVTYIELAQGCRNKAELLRLKKGLAQRNTEVIAITQTISERAMLLIDLHALGSGLQLGEALIAATALEHGLTLLTANTKHFSQIAGLPVERFDPAAGFQ